MELVDGSADGDAVADVKGDGDLAVDHQRGGAGRTADGIPEPPDTELWARLAALPDKQQGAVVYHHVAGLPYAEVITLDDSAHCPHLEQPQVVTEALATFAKRVGVG